MSNPVRQMNHRRLPPLPGNTKRGTSPKHCGTGLHRSGHRNDITMSGSSNDADSTSWTDFQNPEGLVVTGYKFTSPTRRTNQNSSRPPSGMVRNHIDLSSDLVLQYLNDNPDFLENYVLNHVNQERLQRWTAWKEQVRRQRHGDTINGKLNGEIIADRKASQSKWKASLHSKKWSLLHELTRDIHNHTNKAQVLIELASCIATATSAEDYSLYLVNPADKDLYYQKPISNNNSEVSSSCIGKARLSTTLAGYVAYTGEAVRTGDILADDRFPEGLAVGGEKCQSVLGLPILKADGTMTGVIELYKNVGGGIFTLEDEEVAMSMLMWADICVEYVEMYNCMTKQRKLNDFLLAVTKSIFQDIVSMDTVIMKIMHNAQLLVAADRASLFLLDQDRCELYARIFDIKHHNDVTDMAASLNKTCGKEIRTRLGFDVSIRKKAWENIETKEETADNQQFLLLPQCFNYAKKLVNADRASLFLLDTNTNELYARIFDTGKVDEKLPAKEIRFPMDKGVAGHVASTGEILNIADAYTDKRFNREVDMQTGYRTKSILCMPIYNRGNIIGVVQMVNKLNGTFTKSDEESFETFAVYCGLALHHAKLYEKIRRSEQKYRVALEVLSYHSQSSEEEFQAVKQFAVPDKIPNITHYHFSPWAVTSMEKPVHVLYMFKDLFSGIVRYDLDSLIRFTLTVRKNYRNVPYHNWDHAFSVAHAAYTVIKTSTHMFTPQESLALFVACLCHDLDHRGKTNAFMVKSASPLAAIYSTSTMEHHHFNQTVTILQNEGHNIFKYLNSEDYKQMLSDIRNCILATDLALFFGNKAKLKDIADKNDLIWEDDEHRNLVMYLSMTASDLCAMYKPWATQLDLVYVIMEEFWQQGDEEKAKGITPMPMMDREKKHELPQLEVGFLVGICLPCYELMAQVLPETQPMKDGALANMKKWKELAEKSREEVEEELRIDSSKRRDSLIQFGENPDDEKTDEFKRDEDIPEENESVGEDVSVADSADSAAKTE